MSQIVKIILRETVKKYYNYFNLKLNSQISRSFLQYSPYPVKVYSNFCNMINEDRSFFYFQNFISQIVKSNKINIFSRHDIDTCECLKNLPLLVDIDLCNKISSPCYLRVDEEEYTLSEASKIVDRYIDAGIEFGLHTVCYTEDDYLKAFENETFKFEKAFGFRPKTFTVHGLGQYRLDVRNRFYSDISTRLHDFGYDFSDCCPNLRTYHYVIEDCHWSEKEQCRFIYDDFIKLPENIKPGMNVLILTHPCYWVP